MDEWDNLCGRCFGKRLLKLGECCLIDEKQQQGRGNRACFTGILRESAENYIFANFFRKF